MSLGNFIPEVWSGQLHVALRKSHIAAQPAIVNRDYQGEISALGDRVHVHSHGAIAVSDYEKQSTSGDGTDPENHTGTTLVRQRLESSRRSLIIDQAKYFNFEIDDVDDAQNHPKVMQGAMSDAAYRLADVEDRHILQSLYPDVPEKNQLGTAVAPIDFTGAGAIDQAYDHLVDLATLLDEASVPQTGRWVILPPWYRGLVRKDDRFVATGDLPAAQTRANGEVGEAAGFRVFVSNNLARVATNTASVVIAGHNLAASHASQVSSVEAYRPEDAFSDAVKGLELYGSKLIEPDGWAILFAQNTTVA